MDGATRNPLSSAAPIEPASGLAADALQSGVGEPGTKHFNGCYLLFRKTPQGLKKRVGAGRPPRFRHETFESAEREALRLLESFQESTFIIMREVATVKMRAAAKDLGKEA